MVFQDLKNVFTDILPGLSLPAGAACFVIARAEWIRQGEVEAFDFEAPSPWHFNDLCTLAFLFANHEIDAARLMVANLSHWNPDMRVPKFLLPAPKKLDLGPKNGQIWPKTGILGQISAFLAHLI